VRKIKPTWLAFGRAMSTLTYLLTYLMSMNCDMKNLDVRVDWTM